MSPLVNRCRIAKSTTLSHLSVFYVLPAHSRACLAGNLVRQRDDVYNARIRHSVIKWRFPPKYHRVYCVNTTPLDKNMFFNIIPSLFRE